MTEAVTILGSTGSVGCSTLEVIRLHPDRYRVAALSANRNVDLMVVQCAEFRPDRVVMVDPEAAASLRDAFKDKGLQIPVDQGDAALDTIAGADAATVVCAIVGAAGLASTLAAVKAGCRILVANKEPLVMLGSHIMALARQHGATLLPVDSEHNAIFQCLPMGWQRTLGEPGGLERHGVKRLMLTGSGGPFRDLELDALETVTPDQACRHPNWEMGRKISVDSATMMNKGLELIEACELFGLDEDDIDIVIHPQSVVHSMVEYADGSVLAQMANPDMKVPIANALAWPERVDSGVPSLDLFTNNRFDFSPPDDARFPALRLARAAAKQRGTTPCILNAANEVAVESFLGGRIRFPQITGVVEETLGQVDAVDDLDLDVALAADREARRICEQLVERI